MNNLDSYNIDKRDITLGDNSFFIGYGSDIDEAYDEYRRHVQFDSQVNLVDEINPSIINIQEDKKLPLIESIHTLNHYIGERPAALAFYDNKFFIKNKKSIFLDQLTLNLIDKGLVLPSTSLYNLLKKDDMILSLDIKSIKARYKVTYQKTDFKKVKYFFFYSNNDFIYKSNKFSDVKKEVKKYSKEFPNKSLSIKTIILDEKENDIFKVIKEKISQRVKVNLTTGQINIDKKNKISGFVFLRK